MDTTKLEQIQSLLRANSMVPEVLDCGTLSQLFLAQMKISLYGGRASLPMLPTFLKPFGPLPDDAPVAVAVLDDAEVRVCLVRFRDRVPTVEGQDSFPIPGRDYPAPLGDLLYAAAELLEPLLGEAKAVALCLPFPLDYDGKGDAAIRRFPGTMTVQDFRDRPVRAMLAEELKGRGFDRPIVLVPTADAVAAAAALDAPKGSRCLGLTWGTDIDAGFTAPGSLVLRWHAIDGALMLFDVGLREAACVPFGKVDLPKDRDSYAPGEDLLLKMVSTDYLGDAFRLIMIQAAEAKLLSFGCSRDILSLTRLGLDDVTAFLRDPVGGGTVAHFCREPDDREVALILAGAVLDRAAQLVCAALAAVVRFIGADAQVGVSGAAFAQPELRALLEERLAAALPDRSVVLRDGDPAIGAAAAALYQQDR